MGQPLAPFPWRLMPRGLRLLVGALAELAVPGCGLLQAAAPSPWALGSLATAWRGLGLWLRSVGLRRRRQS